MRWILGFLPLLLATVHPPTPEGFSKEKAPFSVKYKKETTPYRVNSLFSLPEEVVSFEIFGDASERGIEASATGGVLEKVSSRSWTWRAPKMTGAYQLEFRRESEPDAVLFNAFVTVPFERLRHGKVNGYRVGDYPTTPLKGLAIYRPPAGFVEVTEANRRSALSPHFRLEQFLCKQPGGYPKYAVLQERLLLKLELLLEEVNRRGFRTDGFHVMSGYRTPFYNQAIGNVRYSRHVWGGAADIFIDENPKDGIMDDLNRDGKIDERDAGALYEIVDDAFRHPIYAPLVGGLGRYRKTAAHGPFVHVDVRGFRARWGS